MEFLPSTPYLLHNPNKENAWLRQWLFYETSCNLITTPTNYCHAAGLSWLLVVRTHPSSVHCSSNVCWLNLISFHGQPNNCWLKSFCGSCNLKRKKKKAIQVIWFSHISHWRESTASGIKSRYHLDISIKICWYFYAIAWIQIKSGQLGCKFDRLMDRLGMEVN